MENESSVWLKEHETCSLLGQDIMVLVNKRDQITANTVPYHKLSSELHSKSKQFSSKIQRLQEGLVRASRSYQITERESERRQGMNDKLVTKQRQIEQATTPQSSRPRDPFDAANDNDEEYASMTHETFRQKQQQIFDEQDQGLDSLSKVVGRQKQMALDIGNEVDTQNEIIDDINDHTGRTDSRIKAETRHIKIVDRKSGACGFWIVIILLIISIIVVIAIPYKKK